MKATTYTHARNNLASLIHHVCEDSTPTMITNQAKGETVVMLSLRDYESIQETNYLLKSPQNAKRLLASIKDAEEGKHTKRELIEDK